MATSSFRLTIRRSENLDDLHRLLTEARIGTKASIGVLRGTDRLDIEVPVRER